MSRRRLASKRVVLPDVQYGSVLLSRFINVMMRGGKRACSEKLVYQALVLAAKKLQEEDVISVFNAIISNVRPAVEVRSRRVGGATYQVPVEVRDERSVSLAFRWIKKAVNSSRKNTNKSSVACLMHEFVEAYNKRGGAYKVREEKFKMAEANKAFSHFRFNN